MIQEDHEMLGTRHEVGTYEAQGGAVSWGRRMKRVRASPASVQAGKWYNT